MFYYSSKFLMSTVVNVVLLLLAVLSSSSIFFHFIATEASPSYYPCSNTNLQLDDQSFPTKNLGAIVIQIPPDATYCTFSIRTVGASSSSSSTTLATFDYIQIISSSPSSSSTTPIRIGSITIQNLLCNNSFASSRAIDSSCILFSSPISSITGSIVINNVNLENLQTPVLSSETAPFALTQKMKPSLVRHDASISGISSGSPSSSFQSSYAIVNCSITTASPTSVAPASSYFGNYYTAFSAR